MKEGILISINEIGMRSIDNYTNDVYQIDFINNDVLVYTVFVNSYSNVSIPFPGLNRRCTGVSPFLRSILSLFKFSCSTK